MKPDSNNLEVFKIWPNKIKEYAIDFNIDLNSQGLFPSDYEDDFSFTTEEAQEYLTKRFQLIAVETDNKKIVGFRNNTGESVL